MGGREVHAAMLAETSGLTLPPQQRFQGRCHCNGPGDWLGRPHQCARFSPHFSPPTLTTIFFLEVVTRVRTVPEVC
jgi:hypothetical protein